MGIGQGRGYETPYGSGKPYEGATGPVLRAFPPTPPYGPIDKPSQWEMEWDTRFGPTPGNMELGARKAADWAGAWARRWGPLVAVIVVGIGVAGYAFRR